MNIFGIEFHSGRLDNQHEWTSKLMQFFKDRAMLTLLSGLAVLTWWDTQQSLESIRFTVDNLLGIAPFILLSIGLTAYAKASGADGLIARVFTGKESTMIILAALMGGLSPFCSCGVIPLIAALLAMGVPLAPVMAFWLASPLMDPSMFFLTAGTLDRRIWNLCANALWCLFTAFAGRSRRRRLRWCDCTQSQRSCLEILEIFGAAWEIC